MSLDLSFDRIRRQQCNLFRFHRHRSPGTTRVVMPALPPSALHWALAGRSDGTRAQFILLYGPPDLPVRPCWMLRGFQASILDSVTHFLKNDCMLDCSGFQTQ
jgi:hypothetical protein